MNATTMQFDCPHCAQRLEIEPAQEGQEVSCPTCAGSIRLDPNPPAAPTTEREAIARRWSLLGPVIAGALVGAALIHMLTWNPLLTLVGALLGGLYGNAKRRDTERRRAGDPRWLRKQALSGLRATAISWILLAALWGWVLTRPPETFHDQGGMVITFVVLPVTLVLWIAGGPVAFVRGWSNRWREITPAMGHWVIVGLVLSGLLSLAGVGFLVKWMSS